MRRERLLPRRRLHEYGVTLTELLLFAGNQDDGARAVEPVRTLDAPLELLLVEDNARDVRRIVKALHETD